jgi:hypothetical protein
MVTKHCMYLTIHGLPATRRKELKENLVLSILYCAVQYINVYRMKFRLGLASYYKRGYRFCTKLHFCF